MSATGLLLVLLTAALTMAANLLLRAGIDAAGGFSLGGLTAAVLALVKLFMQPRFVVGFGLYFLASVVWFRVVATEPLSVAYPLLVSCTFILVTAGAALAFREPLTLRQVLGLAVILLGIVLVSIRRGRQRDPDRHHRLRLLGPNLVRNFAEMPTSEVAAVADLDTAKLESVQRRFPALEDDDRLPRAPERSRDRRHRHRDAGEHPLRARHGGAQGRQARVAREADDRDVAAGAPAGRRGRASASGSCMVDHTFIYTGAVRKMGEIIHSGELGADLLLRLDPREPRPLPARRQRHLGPRRPRLLDPRLPAARASRRRIRERHQPFPRARRRTSPTSRSSTTPASSRTSTSAGSRR